MKKQQEPALGRGLDALLGNANPTGNGSDVSNVNLDLIEPNPYQPRQEFDEESLAGLAESIKSIGLVQPVTLKQVSHDKYLIISGERRVRAARKAGLHTIPAYIRKVDDVGMLEMAIVENIQREDLDPVDTALSFRRLIEECNLTQEEMADRVGKKRSSVANYLRLLNLPPEIQKALKAGKITMGHAKALLSLADASDQDAVCEEIIRKDLSVRAAEEMVASLRDVPAIDHSGNSPKRTAKSVELTAGYSKVRDILGKYVCEGCVSVKRSGSGSGSVTMKFGNDDELASFLKVLEESDI
ncbi:MAG: ParB/RepB/Spo0J family partition protein [Bacteroidales bacterium]|jgi:ParB family chromosome partitioning protein|nr:ParB/RepB/Spo0J family partition protein [Bacteroidales bacterium]MCI2145376.1 ParB/RepB/Spo0J family partition protein [Bacteroidales bacterium]